ncbi:MAG: ACP S-malonyltransferase [Actinomycetota bacterium]
MLFPGQGSQLPGMADPWASHEVGRAVLEEASEAVGYDLLDACRDEGRLATTEFMQPALLACDVAAFRVLAAEGIGFDAAAGHSLGEFAALVAAGVLDLASALGAVVVRGRAMQMAAEQRPGAMTAIVGLGPEEAAEICEIAGRGDTLTVANENASNQVVLSGTVAAIERAEEAATSLGAKAIRLKVAGAFHSLLMQPAVEPIREALAKLEFREPRFPIVANVSGSFVGEPSVIRDLLTRHVVSPVHWVQSMRALADAGCGTFIEAGPGKVLMKLVKRDLPGVRAASIGSPQEAAAFARRLTEDVPS